MALIRYLETRKIALTATPLDLRAALSDDSAAETGWTALRYFVQAEGDGVEWADATAAPAAAGPWHSLPDGAAVVLPIFDAGDIRPWFRGAGASIVVSDANAPDPV